MKGHLISEKVDIWALGVILFKLAFSQTPFEDSKGNVDSEAIIKGLEDRKVGNVGQECAWWWRAVCGGIGYVFVRAIDED